MEYDKKMKRLIQLSILILLAFPASAQQQADESAARVKEREVKISGDYLYGESVANTKDEAVKLAKSILVSEINKEILTRKDWQYAKTISAKDVEYTVESIDLVRGSKMRAIAYVRKDGIEAIFEKGKPPVVNLADKKVEKESAQTNPQDQSTSTEQQAQIVSATGSTNEEEKEKQVQELADTDSTEELEDVGIIVDPLPVSTNNPVLDEVLRCKTAREVSDVFENYKKKGKLMYGRDGTNLSADNSYFMIYNQSGEIIAFLDKGQGSTRKSLLTGEQVSIHSFINASQVWFQIYE